jgi:[FeFe] hydrogenase H-cluster maturation GTPase HydF
MQDTPKGNRIHIAILGRTNVGKSSYLNLLCGQDVSITSDVRGTTTDVVEKAMELLPLGPVLFLDTAGLDDTTALGAKRVERTEKVFERADIILLVLESHVWTAYEDAVLEKAKEAGTPVVAVINKCDVAMPDDAFMDLVVRQGLSSVKVSSKGGTLRDTALAELKNAITHVVAPEYFREPQLISDLVRGGEIAVLVVPIDLEAPKGRLILPQVQTIRDALDADAVCVVTKERELPFVLENLKTPPKLVVCDSQGILKVSADVPPAIALTTFSVLMSRFKGDLVAFAEGAAKIDALKEGSKVLIAESCTHHAIGDDIGRVKLPRWLRQYCGFDVAIDHFSGRDFPADLSQYDLIIHCGSCMLNRKQMLWRVAQAKKAHVAITNYGMAISKLQGVFERVVRPFGL